MSSGELIDGRYRLLDVIGRGGMGEVRRAEDRRLGRQVAVKCLQPPPGPPDDPLRAILRERFTREARTAAALQHPGITTVHDFGEDADRLYLVMELLDGENLAQLLAREVRLTPAETADTAAQIAAALAYTHARGIVHRDLKPANVMRTTDGTVKICDFGIARIGREMGTRLTGKGTALGTPNYMSPEQVSGEELDHRSDLYSLGCLIHEMLLGAPPFDFPDPLVVMARHREAEPEPVRARRPEVPAELDALVARLLAKRPEDRPADAVEAGQVLAALAPGGRPQPAPPPPRAPELPPWARRLTGGTKAGRPAEYVPAADPALTTTVWRAGRSAAPTSALPSQAPTRTLPAPDPGPDPLHAAGLARRHRHGLELASAGRWDDAADEFSRVAVDRAEALGPVHRDTLASRFEQGYALGRARRWAESLAVYETVAAARAAELGPDDPETLRVRQEMGFTLGRLGRHGEAHAVYADVLRRREAASGPDDPDTLRCRHNMAVNLGRMGRPAESHRIAAETAEARARALGADDPETLASRYEVGIGLGRLDRWEEALTVHREVAAARTRILGPHHADTLASRYEAAFALGRLGRADEALAAARELVAVRTEASGPDHPDTLRARHARGVALGRLGRWDEALAEAREVTRLRERTLGADHPDTLVSRREVAVGLGWLGRWNEALDHYRDVADARERTLGAAHPAAVAARADQALCLERLGRPGEAAALRGGAA